MPEKHYHLNELMCLVWLKVTHTIKSVKSVAKKNERHQNLNALYLPPIFDHITSYLKQIQSLKKLFFNL